MKLTPTPKKANLGICAFLVIALSSISFSGCESGSLANILAAQGDKGEPEFEGLLTASTNSGDQIFLTYNATRDDKTKTSSNQYVIYRSTSAFNVLNNEYK